MDNQLKNENNIKSKSKKRWKFSFKKLSFVSKIVITVITIAVVLGIGTAIPTVLKQRETVLELGFKDVGELVTQESYIRILEDSKDDRKIFKKITIPFTESRLIFSLDVEVLASIDFNEISYKTIKNDEGENSILITLPHAKIYKAYEVPKTFKAYLDSESLFSRIDATEQANLKDAVVEKGKEQAIESGILDKAEKNAEVMIRNFVSSNKKTKNYKVKFEYK